MECNNHQLVIIILILFFLIIALFQEILKSHLNLFILNAKKEHSFFFQVMLIFFKTL